ncbi:MAG: alpha/beta hydrolase [Thaumarchaeota archaeon]|nr:alpha/beta hydrolase [Nitrososphaerota archaeon]
MPTFDAVGVQLFYEGRGEGRTAVFVHGVPTDYRAWTAQTEPFSRGRRMVAVSRRYAFPNTRDGDVMDSTVQNNASDLKVFLEKIGGGPVDLVGHSYGGFVSAFLAAERPGLVRSLVLVEPAVSTFLVADQASSAQVLALLLKSPSVALSARRFQSKSLAPSLKALEAGDLEKAVKLNVEGVQDSPGAFTGFSPETREMMLDNAKTIAELKTVFPRFTAKEAGKIACPALVVNGEMSALWLRKIGQLLARSIPRCRSVLVPGARHFPHMESPGFFNDAVLSFLAQA